MSDPLIDVNDLATYMADESIDEPRALLMLSLAQTACESVLSPLPAGAVPIVMRIAARGYTSVTSSGVQAAMSGSPFGVTPGGAGGVYVTTKDEYDLLRCVQSAQGVSAFTIHTRPGGPSRAADSGGGWVWPSENEMEHAVAWPYGTFW